MATRIKARVGKRWFTGNSVQELVDHVVQDMNRKQGEHRFREYCENYMAIYKANGSIVDNTLIGYKGYLKNHLYPAFGNMNVEEISVDSVQQYINSKADSLTEKTIQEHLNLMRSIFDGAVEDDIVSKNPFRSKRLRVCGKKNSRVEAYTEAQFHELAGKLLPKLDGGALLYAAISMYTGMRRGEVCALRWEDIDFTHNVIHVSKSVAWPAQNKGVIKTPKTGNGVRDVVIMPSLFPILASNRANTGYVVRGQRSAGDEPITNQARKRLTDRIDLAAEACGIRFRFDNRQARHTMATFMNNAGVDDKTMENQLGHATAAFTRRRYMNAQPEQVVRGMGRLAEYLQ